MSKLLPWVEVKMAPVNIETLDEEHIPEKPGVYVWLSHRTEYVYPWSDENGSSRIYYIGRSTKLRTRLKTHKKYGLERISDPDLGYYWPPIKYAARHGCNVVWEISMNPKDRENEQLVAFASYYGAKPVANGQSGWPLPMEEG